MTLLRRTRRALPFGMAVLLGVSLAGCADDGTGGGSGTVTTSVTYGADKQAYIDALADMEPVTLTIQSPAPKGAATGRRFEAYAAAVEEWSGGKIKFNVVFSNGVAPPAEVDDALADGRLDVGSIIPSLEPADFPASNALWELSFIGRQTPVDGQLQWHGAMLETAVGLDEIYQEYERKGIKLLLPAFAAGAFYVNCADSRFDLASLKGRDIAIQSKMQGTQAQALGMNPVSANYAEMFESLQRGIVDCTMSSLTISLLGGYIPAAPHFAYHPEIGIQSPGGSIAISLDRWNALPLAAQQLLYDRLDVLLDASLKATWENVAAGLKAVKDAKGSFVELTGDALEALRKANDDALAAARSSAPVRDPNGFVDTLLKAVDTWGELVRNVGIRDVTVGYDGFEEWHAAGVPDLQSYYNALWERALDKRRPS